MPPTLRIAGSDDDGRKPEQPSMPPHVQEFLAISGELDAAVRSKDEAAISIAKSKLGEFSGTRTEKERLDCEKFFEREILGTVTEDCRGRFYRNFVRALHIPYRVVGASAEPIAKLTGETIRLIILALGWTIGGVVLGVRDACRGVLNKAA